MKKKYIIILISLIFIASSSYADNYDDIANELIKHIKENSIIAVVDFEYDGDKDSRTPFVLSERVSLSIIEKNKVRVVERKLLENILKEQYIQHTGITDINTVKSIGKILNADFIITGNIYDKDFEKVELYAKAINVETGVILSGIRKEFKKDWVDKIPENDWDKNTDTTTASFYCNMAIKEMDRENLDKAIWLFGQAININITGECGTNKKGFAYYERGKAFIFNEKYDKAIKDLDFYLEMDDKSTEGYFYRGIAYIYKGLYDKAIEDYNKAIELNPKDADAYTNRGFAYYGKDLYDKAIEDYSKAIELKPDFAVAYYNRGNAYDDKGLYDKAIEDYSKAIELDPKDADTYNNRGIAYRNKGLYDKAIEDFSKVIELKPDFAKAYNNRGIAYELKGLHDKAEKDYKMYNRLTGR
jgi:tetratricopeptide (TPR) repeat protein